MEHQLAPGGVLVSHRLDAVIRALVLVRLGQELGTDGEVARAIYSLIGIVISALG